MNGNKLVLSILGLLLCAIAAVGLMANGAKADAKVAKETADKKVTATVAVEIFYPKSDGKVLENAVLNITTILNEIKVDIKDIKQEQARAQRRGR